jgi:hypothetical protein
VVLAKTAVLSHGNHQLMMEAIELHIILLKNVIVLRVKMLGYHTQTIAKILRFTYLVLTKTANMNLEYVP